MTKEQTLRELHKVMLQSRALRDTLKKLKHDLSGAHDDFNEWCLYDKLTEVTTQLNDLAYDCGSWISGESEAVATAVATAIGATLAADGVGKRKAKGK